MTALQRLRVAIVLFAIVVVTGVVGYHMIEDWPWDDSVWMVFITLTTIGYAEVHDLSDSGRLFTVVLVISGLSLGSYAASQATVYFVEGGFRRDYRERRRRQLMSELADHFIVAGYGRTGREIAEDLRHAGHRAVIIDLDAEVCDACARDGLTAIRGDASHDDVLKQAGIERAAGLAVATSSDAVNVFVTLSARQLRPKTQTPKLRIMCRVDEEHSGSKAELAGADGVVSPHIIGGTNMANALLRPHSATFMRQAFARTHPDLAMEDVVIGTSTAYHDTLGNLHLREHHRVMVVAIQKQDGSLIPAPGPAALLQTGDVMVVVGRTDDINRLRTAAEDDVP